MDAREGEDLELGLPDSPHNGVETLPPIEPAAEAHGAPLPGSEGVPLTARIHQGHAAVSAQLAAWTALVEAVPQPQPTPGFLLEAARLGPGAPLLVEVCSPSETLAWWPLARRRRGPWSLAERMGGALQPYDCLALAPHADEDTVIACAIGGLRDLGVDLLRLGSVLADHPLATARPLAHALRRTHPNSIVELSPDLTWDRFVQRCSKSRRKSLRRHRRRLAAQGELAFSEVSGPGARLATLHRALDYKRAWLDAHGIVSPTLSSGRFVAVLEAMVGDPRLTRDLPFFQLTVDGHPVAMELAVAQGTSLLGWMGGFDPAHRAMGPGAQLTVEIVVRAAGRGFRLYDFLPPLTPFKESLSHRQDPVCTGALPLSRLGRLGLPLAHGGRAQAKGLVQRLPPSLRRGIGALALQAGRFSR